MAPREPAPGGGRQADVDPQIADEPQVHRHRRPMPSTSAALRDRMRLREGIAKPGRIHDKAQGAPDDGSPALELVGGQVDALPEKRAQRSLDPVLLDEPLKVLELAPHPT